MYVCSELTFRSVLNDKSNNSFFCKRLPQYTKRYILLPYLRSTRDDRLHPSEEELPCSKHRQKSTF